MIRVEGSRAASAAYRRIAIELGTQAQRGTFAAGAHILGHMKSTKLSGQRLRVRTGKLRSNWRIRPLGGIDGLQAVRGGSARVVGVAVTTNTGYAAVHEYGKFGIVQVREHDRINPIEARRRREKARRQRVARFRRLGKVGKVRARQEARRAREDSRRANALARSQRFQDRPALKREKLRQRRERGIQGMPLPHQQEAAPGMVRVAAHPRFVRMRARRFLRDSVAEQSDRALAIMRASVRGAIGG